MPGDGPREVLFVLQPDLVLLDLAGPADAFRNALQQQPGSYRLRFLAAQPELTAAGGLTLGALEPLSERVGARAIVVLHGLAGDRVDPRRPGTREVIEWLRSPGVRPGTLMCVCAGAVLAAHAGLLDGRACTTHHAHLEELRQVAPGAQVLENRIFVADGAVYTSAGVTAGLDLALHIIGRQLGPRIAADIARELVVYLRRAGSDPALSPWVMHRNHLHKAVHRVQDAVAREPGGRWSSAALAAVACTSPRNLTRLFAEHAGCSPLDYVQLMRFALARQLITQTRLDLEQVALRAGFHSAQHLRRVWARWEAQPPSVLRSRSAAAWPQ